MGQSSSRKGRRGATEVERRTRDGGRRDRPASFTYGESGASPNMDPNAQRFGLSANSASMDLTGLRHHGYPNDPDVRRNPIGAEDSVDDNDGVSSHQTPYGGGGQIGGKKSEPKGDLKAAYYASLEDVLGIWPEYDPLKDFKFSKNNVPLQATLQQVFKRLVEQHTSIGKMSRDNHDLRQDLQVCKNDIESLSDSNKQKEKELNECISDIGFLRGELKRRGFDPKIPGRHQPEKKQSLTVESRDHHGHNRNLSDISDTVFEDPKDEIEHKMRHKESKGQAIALPLLVAEGREGQANILRRHSSFKDAHPPPFEREHRTSFRGNQPTLDREHRSSFRADRESHSPRNEDQNRLIDDLNERIRRLQTQLENERRTSNNLMRRLDDDKASSRDSTIGRPSASLDELSRLYADLESVAMFKIKSSMDRLLGHVRGHRKQEFLCAIMERCYEHASRHMNKFEKTVRELLQRPLDKLDISGTRRREAGRSGRVSSHGEVPGALVDKLVEFLESTAENVDITSLVHIIIEDLQDEYSDCTTAAMLNHTGFNNFIHDCARLAWRMILVTPPMVISTETARGFDSRSNTIASDEVLNPREGHEIKIYLWPTLLSRRRGDVLTKGRVILKVER